MNVNERVKELRTSLGLSQEEFGKKIGISKSGVSSIENEQRNVTNKHIKLLVLEFGVNEEWLRTGEGEMFIKLSRDDELVKWAGSLANPNNNDDFVKKFVNILSKLSAEEWKVLEKMALMMVEEMDDTKKD